MVDELQLITGIDIPVKELGLSLKQPKIKEIAMLGEQDYFVALQLFLINKEKLKIQSDEITSWQIFQESLLQKIEGIDNPRVLALNFLQLFLTPKVNFGPLSILLTAPDSNEVVSIEPADFEILQQYIGAIGGASLLTQQEEKFKPKNKRAAEIAEKMKKARKRLAAMQPQSTRKGFLARYVRALAVATANSLEEVNNMTLLQLNELVQTYLLWEDYDLEIKSRLAGAKGDDKLTHWIARDPGNENDSIGTLEG